MYTVGVTRVDSCSLPFVPMVDLRSKELTASSLKEISFMVIRYQLSILVNNHPLSKEVK